jgi:hypothetical protein
VPGPYVKKEDPDRPPPAASRFALEGLTVTVELLDDAARAAFIRSIEPRSRDPFASPPGGPALFHAFRVVFENGTGSAISFQPGNVVLATDRNDQQFPIDLPDIYMEVARAGKADPDAAMAEVQPLIFDSSTTIPNGRRLERMLVFGPLPEKWKEFHLLFSFLQIGTETHTLTFTFHKQILKA